MAIASGSWVATVNHHSFTSPTKPIFFLTQKPHSFHVCSSRCSLVLEEDEKKSPKEDKWPFFEPAPVGLNRVLSKLLRDPETRKLSHEFYEKAKENSEFRTTKHSIIWIMEAYERIGDNHKVVELFQEFKSVRLSFLAKESGSIYATVCSSLVKSGRALEALEVLQETKDRKIPESSALYSTLIRALAEAREVVMVEKLFKEAGEKRLLKDPEMCLKVVLMYVRQGQMEKTLEVVASMTKGGLRVSDCMNGFSKQRGFAEAVKVYEWLTKQQCEAGQVTYAIAINAYCRLEEYDKAETLFEEMVKKGFDKCVVAYSNIMDMYGKTRRLSDAVKLMAKMKQRGCRPNIWIYNSLIDMHRRAMDLRRVEKIWKEMKRMKVLPDKVSYTSMISAYNRAKEFEKCVELYQEFRMNRGKIDRAMAGIMVGAFSKTSRIDELMRLLQDMKVERTKLDLRLYTSALNALRDAGLNSQIRWLQESFDTAQTRTSKYSNTKNIRTLQGS